MDTRFSSTGNNIYTLGKEDNFRRFRLILYCAVTENIAKPVLRGHPREPCQWVCLLNTEWPLNTGSNKLQNRSFLIIDLLYLHS